MLAESAKNLVPKFFDETGTTYDGVVSYGTLGKDKYWKRKMLEQISDGDSFLDLACGTGILTREIAEKFPSAKIVGIDITKSYLDVAKQNSDSFDNISFVLDDAEKFKLDSKFDCITGSYLPKYCDPEILVKNCIAHLKPGGKSCSMISHIQKIQLSGGCGTSFLLSCGWWDVSFQVGRTR